MIKSPEEQELDEKNRQLEELETEFAALQLDYSTLSVELTLFRDRYNLRVGIFYAQLDALRAEICEVEAQLSPRNENVRIAAKAAREQANATYDEVNEFASDGHAHCQPTEELKKLYRQAAKLIHPDRAIDEDDRQLRDRLMADINVAYSKGNADAITSLVAQYRDQLTTTSTDNIGTQLVRAIRSIAKTKERINALVSAIAELNGSKWATLKLDIESKEARGKDPLGQLGEKIQRDIISAKEELELLRSKLRTDSEALSLVSGRKS